MTQSDGILASSLTGAYGAWFAVRTVSAVAYVARWSSEGTWPAVNDDCHFLRTPLESALHFSEKSASDRPSLMAS